MIKSIKTAMWDIIRTEGIEVTNQNIDWLLERAWKSAQVSGAPSAETRDKKIEEMAKDLCNEIGIAVVIVRVRDDGTVCLAGSEKYLKNLVYKGYRKASEFAAEIFEELKTKAPWFCENQIAYEHFYEELAELEKKYAEGERIV